MLTWKNPGNESLFGLGLQYFASRCCIFFPLFLSVDRFLSCLCFVVMSAVRLQVQCFVSANPLMCCLLASLGGRLRPYPGDGEGHVEVLPAL